MYKHECYKIFSRKSIYLVLFLILILMTYANPAIEGDLTLKGEEYNELFKEWGGPVTEEKLAEAREHMEASDAGLTESKSPEAYAEDEVHYLTASAGINLENLQNRKEYLREKIQAMNKQSYEYRLASKELRMLQKLDQPFGFYLIRSWRGMFDFIDPLMTVILLTTLILLGLTPVFVDEYTNRTMELIFVTKNGRREIITAKLLASITYISSIFIILHTINFGLQWMKYGGAGGWNAPVQNLNLWSLIYFDSSPYSWTVGQFYGITLTIQLLASIGIALLVILLSMIFKNTMMTILGSIAIIAGPAFIGEFAPNNKAIQLLKSFNYVEWLKSAPLFEDFQAYKVFAYPVLYPTLLLSIFMLFSFLVLLLIYKIHNRTELGS